MAVTSPTFQVEFFHLDVPFAPAHGADIPAEDGIRALSAAAAAQRPQHQAGESDDRPVHHPLPVGVRSWRSHGRALKVHRRGERAEAALVWANTAAPDKLDADVTK